MKNKWFLLLMVLIIFNNINAFSQGGTAQIEEAWTQRIQFTYPCRHCWFDDPIDLVGSLQHERFLDSINLTKYYREANNHTIDSLIKIATSTKERLEIRYSAINSLASIKSKRQVPALEKMLLNEMCDSCESIRSTCAYALILLRSIDSKNVLIKALKEKNVYMKLMIASFLASIGEKEHSFKTLKYLWSLNLGFKNGCHDGYRDINTSESIDIIRTDLTDKNPVVVLDAAALMAQLDYKDEANSKLIILLKNEDKYIRIGAMRVLAYYVGDKKSFEAIKEMENDKDSDVRSSCNLILRKYAEIIKSL